VGGLLDTVPPGDHFLSPVPTSEVREVHLFIGRHFFSSVKMHYQFGYLDTTVSQVINNHNVTYVFTTMMVCYSTFLMEVNEFY